MKWVLVCAGAVKATCLKRATGFHSTSFYIPQTDLSNRKENSLCKTELKLHKFFILWLDFNAK
jgi:hypothetical protein